MRLTSAEIGYFEDLEDEEVLEVAVAGLDESGARRSFSIQCSTGEPDEQDVQYGMDTHCVSTERGATLYGCLRAVLLEGTVLTLEFVAEDAEVLEIAPSVEVELGDADVTELGGRLHDLLERGASAKRPDLRIQAAHGPSPS
ncbi:Imm10 family immunity protein [Lentzea sp. NPDC003310]|uniref:Imm10 family immunity protein n=1 Tax=Lentzea sp. NPDC003310 TaxID=3154447 RepID=UPI0033A8F4DF